MRSIIIKKSFNPLFLHYLSQLDRSNGKIFLPELRERLSMPNEHCIQRILTRPHQKHFQNYDLFSSNRDLPRDNTHITGVSDIISPQFHSNPNNTLILIARLNDEHSYVVTILAGYKIKPSRFTIWIWINWWIFLKLSIGGAIYILWARSRRNLPLVEDRDLERAPFDKWACNLNHMISYTNNRAQIDLIHPS